MVDLRILITGGAGRLGARLVEALLGRGAHVRVIDLREHPGRERLSMAVLDVRDPAIHEEFSRFHPDIVIHLAGQSDEAASHADPEHDAEHNVIGTLNALHAAKMSGAKRFIFASSDAARGDAGPTEAPCPRSPFGVAKYAGERYCGCYHTIYGLSYAAVRLPHSFDEAAAADALLAAIDRDQLGIVDLV